jgi:hypothetical protein
MRAKLKASAVAAGKEIKAAGRREMTESVAAMEKRGLKVTKLTPEVEALWREAAESVYPQVRGNIVPEDVFDEALRFIKEYRAKHP